MIAKSIEQNFISNFLDSIDADDVSITKNFLRHFPDVNSEIQDRILYEISLLPDKKAYAILEFLVHIDFKDISLKEKVISVIVDRAHVNAEFILLFFQIAPKNKIKEAIPLLKHILMNETDVEILDTTIFIVGYLKDNSSVDIIADFIYYGHKFLKKSAVSALAAINTPEAVLRIIEAAKSSKSDDFILKTLEQLKPAQKAVQEAKKVADETPAKIDKLIEKLSDGGFNDRYLAALSLIKMGQLGIKKLINCLNSNKEELIINTLYILARINDQTALPTLRKLFTSKKMSDTIRFAAYEAASQFTLSNLALIAIEGLMDKNHAVRISAAKSCDNNLSDVLLTILKNNVEAGSKQSRFAAEAIIDSKSDNAFKFLLISDSFTHLMSYYLPYNAHPYIRDHYISFLMDCGKTRIAQTIQDDSAKSPKADGPLIYFIDGSDLFLCYFMKVFKEFGTRLVTFTDCEKALDALKNTKPDILLTGLMLNSMSGIDFIKKAREIYYTTDLGIVMITWQKDLKEKLSDKDLRELQIEQIITKTLDEKKLKEKINTLIQKVGTKDKSKDHICEYEQTKGHTKIIKDQTCVSIDQMIEMLGSSVIDLRHTATDQLMSVGVKAVPDLLLNLKSDKPDLIINSIKLLGRIGDNSALPGIQKIIPLCKEDPAIRVAAFDAVLKLPATKSALNLMEGLEDNIEPVRIAAAKALDHNFSDVMIAGLKAKIETGTKQARKIVEAILDAKADNLFGALMLSDAFSYITSYYLANEAHPVILDYNIKFLEQKGRRVMARSILDEVPKSKVNGSLIYFIQESESLLSYYLKRFYKMNFQTLGFCSYEIAKEAMLHEKPDIIIMSLDLPYSSGIRVSEEIKGLPDFKTLPIVMITDQKDYIFNKKEESIRQINEGIIQKAGINQLLTDPFDIIKMSKAVRELLKG